MSSRTEDDRQRRIGDLQEMVCAIGHDLRAPLRAIDGFTHLIELELPLDVSPAVREYLNRTHELVTYSNQLITHLRDFTALGQLQKHRTWVDLSVMAEAIVQGFHAAEPQRAPEVSIEPGLRAYADELLTRRLLQNLIGNAWKFTRHAKQARIRFDSLERETGRVLRLQDNGCGFDPAIATKLFRPFHRVHSQAEYEGEGMGLAIARQIVVQHGGEIYAEGRPGAGATFYFNLPAVDSP